MSQYKLPEMSIAKMQYNPATFQGVNFTPQAPDMNILARSLAQAEERHNTAIEKKSEIDKTLAGLEAKLHNDKETQQWFANYKDNIEKQIQDEVNNGNYGSAIRVATGLAGSILRDPAMQGRIRAEESYQKEVKTQQERRDKGEINQNTFDWWLAHNPYKYQDNYDSEGNIIGGTEYIAEFRPVTDINWAAKAQAAYQMITPYKKTKAKRPSTLGDVTNIKSSTLKGYSYEEQSISEQDILDNIETLLSATPDGYRQAEQAYDVATFELNKMLKQYEELIAKNPNSDEAIELGQKLETRRKLMYKNGSPIDYKEYYARMVTNNLYANKLAYEWHNDADYPVIKGSTTVHNNQQTNQQTFSGSPNYYPGARYDFNTGLWYGPNTRQQTDTENAQQGVGNAASGINSRFK